MLTYEYYLQTRLLIFEIAFRHTTTTQQALVDKRRQAVKTDNSQEYGQALMQLNHLEQLTNRIVQGELYQSLNVTIQIFMKSVEVYGQDPQKNMDFATEV